MFHFSLDSFLVDNCGLLHKVYFVMPDGTLWHLMVDGQWTIAWHGESGISFHNIQIEMWNLHGASLNYVLFSSIPLVTYITKFTNKVPNSVVYSYLFWLLSVHWFFWKEYVVFPLLPSRWHHEIIEGIASLTTIPYVIKHVVKCIATSDHMSDANI